jgi:hypothetical protein
MKHQTLQVTRAQRPVLTFSRSRQVQALGSHAHATVGFFANLIPSSGPGHGSSWDGADDFSLDREVTSGSRVFVWTPSWSRIEGKEAHSLEIRDWSGRGEPGIG